MNLTNFTEHLAVGINNPDCSFFVGSFMGQFIGVKIFFFLVLSFILLRAVEKIAIEPSLNWLKKKIWKKGD